MRKSLTRARAIIRLASTIEFNIAEQRFGQGGANARGLQQPALFQCDQDGIWVFDVG